MPEKAQLRGLLVAFAVGVLFVLWIFDVAERLGVFR
jgi:hypothetical protein